MEWLSPMSAVYAAAVMLPLLLLLYFLKLKRHEEPVSSTFLWRRAVEDLRANAPFQRLRRSILLLLQLLMLAAILLALGGPVLSLVGGAGQRYVILIDSSASMNATDVEPSRLDEAKRQAVEFVDTLRDRSFFSLTENADRAMAITFNEGSKVMCNFTSDKEMLKSAINEIDQTDCSSSLSEAMRVAQAHAQTVGEKVNNRSSKKRAKLVLFSDGRIPDSEEIVTDSGDMAFHCIGKSGENVGFTKINIRRSFDNPAQVQVFAAAANYCSQEKALDVQLSVDDNVRAVREITLPAATGETNGRTPATVSVHFSLDYEDYGILELEMITDDHLPADNVVRAVLSPPRRLSLLLVTDGNAILESALSACGAGRFDVKTPFEFEKEDIDAINVERPYDVIVLDDVETGELPLCGYLVFGRPPDDIGVPVMGQDTNQAIIDWRSQHPVLRYVDMSDFFASSIYILDLPRDGDVLAEFRKSPALAALRRDGSLFLLAGFDVLDTNWPFEPAFVMFCYNALNFIAEQTGPGTENNMTVGRPIELEGLPPGSEAEISGPGFRGGKVEVASSGILRFPATKRAGVYELQTADERKRMFAVNLVDEQESEIEPKESLSLLGRDIASREKLAGAANQALWPLLVVLALILVMIEWFVYNYKVSI